MVKSEVPFIGDYQQDGYSNLYYALVKGRRPLWKKAIKTLSPSFYHYTIFMAFGRIKIDPRDKLFSIMIRERDEKCFFCSNPASQNSHFWGRNIKNTRFDVENCDGICGGCHFKHEGNKQGEYRDKKIAQLGIEGYNELEKRAKQFHAYGKYEQDKLLEILKEQYKNKEHLSKDWKVIW